MMRTTFVMTLFAFVAPLSVHAAPAPQEGLNLVFYGPSFILNDFSANAQAIGTAADGSETTFLYTEVNHFTTLFRNGNGAVTQTSDVTLPGTVVASASGFSMALPSATFSCFATALNAGECRGINAGAQFADAGNAFTTIALVGSPASPTTGASSQSASPASAQSTGASSPGALSAGAPSAGSPSSTPSTSSPLKSNGASANFGGDSKLGLFGVALFGMVVGGLMVL